MTERDALMRTILDEPDDPIPRLVFADWLDEQGEVHRAEFVRAQCRLADLREWEPDHVGLSLRTQALHRDHHLEWFRDAYAFIPRTHFDGNWGRDRLAVRGFVERLPMFVDTFDALADQVFACTPLREVCFLPRAGSVFPDSAHLARLRTIAFDPTRGTVFPDPAAVYVFLIPDAIDDVQRLELPNQGITAHGVEFLAAAQLLQLRSLELGGNPIGDGGVAAFDRGEVRPHLHDLGFSRTGITPVGVRHLVEHSWIRQVTRLDLGRNNRIGDEGAAFLARSPLLGTLSELRLGGCALHEPGTEALARSQALRNVQVLDLSGAKFSPRALADLAGRMTELRSLDLSECELGQEGIRVLFGPDSGLTNVGWLNLSGNDIDDESLRFLAKSPALANLVSLSLGVNPITNVGLDAISESTHSRKLERLSFHGHFGADAVARLLASPALPRLVSLWCSLRPGEANVLAMRIARDPTSAKLRELSVNRADFTDRGANALADSPHLDGLCRLALVGGRVKKSARLRLKDQFGNRVEW